MYVGMCLKVSVNYSQTVGVSVFFHKIQWVDMVLRILNLEGQQNCMIASKVTTILPPFKKKKIKRRHMGCVSRGK